MGSLLSRFRKQPTTLDQLKKIEEGLKKIDDYKRITEKKQKRTVANVIIYSAALYMVACVIVFVWYMPESLLVRLGLLIPLILVPFIIYWMKRVISRYFQNKIVRANEDYADLQRKKKDIIDNVMETETFNRAKEILSKYAPEKLEKKLQERVASSVVTPVPTSTTTDLRKRTARAVPAPAPAPTTVSLTQRPINSSVGPARPLPQPLFNKERSFSDKLVEYIIDDGPGYRYALICKHCKGHNGMALKEEFPFMSYNCCYCMSFNAARCQRPQAPRLPEPPALPALEPKGTTRHSSEPKTEGKFPIDNVQQSRLIAKQTKLVAESDEMSEDPFPKPIPFDDFIEELVKSQDVEVLENAGLAEDNEETEEYKLGIYPIQKDSTYLEELKRKEEGKEESDLESEKDEPKEQYKTK